MTAANFDASLTRVLASEGGYVDHPKDPGSATMYGVTQRVLAAWRGKPATKTDVRNLTKAEAAEIYKFQYWNAVRGNDLPAGLDYVMFDYAVNSGPVTAIKALQRALGVKADGVLGIVTARAASQRKTADLIRAVIAQRTGFLRSLATWTTFGKGWNRRCQEVEAAACRMAGETSSSRIA